MDIWMVTDRMSNLRLMDNIKYQNIHDIPFYIHDLDISPVLKSYSQNLMFCFHCMMWLMYNYLSIPRLNKAFKYYGIACLLFQDILHQISHTYLIIQDTILVLLNYIVLVKHIHILNSCSYHLGIQLFYHVNK